MLGPGSGQLPFSCVELLLFVRTHTEDVLLSSPEGCLGVGVNVSISPGGNTAGWRVQSLHRVTQLISGRVRIQVQALLRPSLLFLYRSLCTVQSSPPRGPAGQTAPGGKAQEGSSSLAGVQPCSHTRVPGKAPRTGGKSGSTCPTTTR